MEAPELTKTQPIGVRELARRTGVSPSTATRFLRGDDVDLATARKMLPFVKACPCCRADTHTALMAEAVEALQRIAMISDHSTYDSGSFGLSYARKIANAVLAKLQGDR